MLETVSVYKCGSFCQKQSKRSCGSRR